jgi:hypothetical protein
MNLNHIKPGDKLAVPERIGWVIDPRMTHVILTVQRTTATQAIATRDDRPNSREVRVRLEDGRVIGENYIRAEAATAEMIAQHMEQMENLRRWRKAKEITQDLTGMPLHKLGLTTPQLERLAAARVEVKAVSMSEKHTPGPWFIWHELAMQLEGAEPDEIADSLLYESEHGIYAGSPKECTRGSLRGHSAHICDIDADGFDYDDDETCRSVALANARLIAAAPDLLEALRLIASTKPVHGMNPDARMGDPVDIKVGWNIHWIARAAIAKAEGGAG